MKDEMSYSEAKQILIKTNEGLKNNRNIINLDNIEEVMEEFVSAHKVAKQRLDKIRKTKDKIMGKINE